MPSRLREEILIRRTDDMHDMAPQTARPALTAPNFRHVSLADMFDDRPEEGIFRLRRDVYTDPDLFEMEMAYIFERTWSFLGFEAQVRKPHDFFTTHIARVPVLVTCDRNGDVGAFLNICRHKGSHLCEARHGNRRNHVCPYHGWTYDSGGNNTLIKDRKQGGYHEAFDRDDHGLVRLPALASYNGLIFGALTEDVPPLDEFLGDMRFFIDLAMDQGPDGMEPVPGASQFTFRANWKFQLENAMDSYHLTSTHQSFMRALNRRSGGEGNPHGNQTDVFKDTGVETGSLGFPYGHINFTMDNTEPQRRPFYPYLDKLTERVGEVKANWMTHKIYTGLIFPNMQLAHASALVLRVIRPLAVDLTEMTSYCLGAVGEPRAERAMRIRAFEDFYNASGLATPDDNVVYERCQQALTTGAIGWLQGHSRGIAEVDRGENDLTRPIGIHPDESVIGTLQSGQEVVFHAAYREWARLIETGQAGQPAYS